MQSVTETALPALKENDTTVMPEQTHHDSGNLEGQFCRQDFGDQFPAPPGDGASVLAHFFIPPILTETALPFLEELPPHDMRAVQRISVRTLLPVTETRLPRLEDFSTTLTAVCKGKATAALQNISETRLPELEE